MNDSVEFLINGKAYKISYPTVGEYYQIECLKQDLSKNNYGGLVSSRTVSGVRALDMIDIEANLTILCPQLIRDLKTGSISKLGILDFKEIEKEYIKTVVPFLKKFYDLMKQE